jgi:hypothetical protein
MAGRWAGVLPASFTAVNRGGIDTGGSNGVFGRIDLCPQDVDSKGMYENSQKQ